MRIYFAPMEGITGYLFRNAHHSVFPGIDKYFTPFLSPNKNRSFTPRELRDVCPENNRGIPLVPQILTNRAEYFLRAAGELREMGYSEVNLNLGCPSGTVVSKGKGAGFLEDPEELDRFFERVFDGLPGDMRLSAKTRLGLAGAEEFGDLLAVFNRYPLSELIVHPRVREDYYGNTPDLEAFAAALLDSKNPVCYNGDIFSASDYREIAERFPRLEAVMCGRGLLSDPALAREAAGGEPLSREELRRFHDLVYGGYREAFAPDERSVLFKMKELWGYLGVLFPDEKKGLKRIKKAQRLDGYEAAVRELL